MGLQHDIDPLNKYSGTALDLLDPAGTRHVFDTEHADTSALTEQEKSARDMQLALDEERAKVNPDKTQQIAARIQQQGQLPALQQAAAGQAPSAAAIEGAQGAGAEAARQFAMAQALRSRNGGAALNAASQGLTAGTAAIGSQAANARALEQAKARGLLAQATTGIRGQDISAYGVDQASRDAQLAALLKEQELRAQNAQSIANANAAAAGATNQKRASILGGGASLGSSILSDKHAKDSIRDRSMADEVAKGVHGVVFDYRPGFEDGGKHFGVIAQEIERVIPGVVQERPGGLKEINAPHLTAANTGLISELARRIKALEDRR